MEVWQKILLGFVIFLFVIFIFQFINREALESKAQLKSSYRSQQINIGGNEYQRFPLRSGQGCMEKCLADPKCAFWSWHYPNATFNPDTCFFMSANPAPKRAPNVMVDSGEISGR